MHFTSRTMTCVIGLTWALAGFAVVRTTNLLPSVGSAGGGATTH
jgi:hypothetical protein